MTLAIVLGSGNAGGRDSIKNLSKEELSVFEDFKIYNVDVNDFSPLHVPFNNESGFKCYGVEIPLAVMGSQKFTHLVKHTGGITCIEDYRKGGCMYVEMKSKIDAAIDLLSKENQFVELSFLVGCIGRSSKEAVYIFIKEIFNDYGVGVKISLFGLANNIKTENKICLEASRDYGNVHYIDVLGFSCFNSIHFDRGSLNKLADAFAKA